MRKKWITRFALVALGLLLTIPAMADEHDTELDPADRALVHSYDPESLQLLWAAVLGDTETAEEECGITAGDSYTYEVDDEGNVTLTAEGEEGEGDSEGEGEGEGDLEEACAFNVTDVEGPEGQVNHGTVVSNFVQDLKDYLAEQGYEGGIGCYVRIIAQSDYGKGDQQVKVSDLETTTTTVADEETTSAPVEFAIDETTCGGPDEDGKGKPEGAGKPEGVGKPENTGRPDWAGTGGPPDHAKGGGR